MSLMDLIPHVSRALADNPSVVITDEDFRRITKLPLGAMTRKLANDAAWLIVHERHDLFAAAEAFLHNETLEPIRVYLICARSREAYQARSDELRRQLEGELDGETARIRIYDHPADREPDSPAPLITPPAGGRDGAV